jgi:hypothetical protein
MEPHATQTRPSTDPTARILAVFALVVAAILVVVVISGSVGGSGDESGGGGRGGGSAHRESQQKYYVVQPGDTFAGIAAKEGISVHKLEQLNPNLDTQLLPQRACVSLVPEGCRVLATGD